MSITNDNFSKYIESQIQKHYSTQDFMNLLKNFILLKVNM